MGMSISSTPLKTSNKMNSGHPPIAEIFRAESTSVRRVVYWDGSKYAGQMKNGRRHGEGALFRPNGTLRYRGGWKENLPHGHGTSLHSGGKTYAGEWRFGKPEGTGTLRISPKANYTGEWKNGRFHGQGIYVSPDRQYKGGWREGKRHGHGTYQCQKGTYRGQWEKGCFHGQGTMCYSDGSLRYEGEMEKRYSSWPGNTCLCRGYHLRRGMEKGPSGRKGHLAVSLPGPTSGTGGPGHSTARGFSRFRTAPNIPGNGATTGSTDTEPLPSPTENNIPVDGKTAGGMVREYTPFRTVKNTLETGKTISGTAKGHSHVSTGRSVTACGKMENS